MIPRQNALFLSVLALLFAGGTVRGQNLEVFALDDFVDPDLLTFPSDGGAVSAAFVTSTVQFGFVGNYQRLGTPTEEDLLFIRLSNNFYYRDFQIGVKMTGLEEPGDERATIVADRLRLEGGYYFKTEYVMEGQAETVSYTNRARVSWDRERLADGDITHAFSLDLDYVLDPNLLPGAMESLEGAMNGWNYTWRKGTEVENGHHGHYLSAYSRFPFRELSDDSIIWLGWGIGAERTLGHTRWGAVRLELALDAPLEVFNTRLRFVFSPSYQLDRGEYNQEISVFVSPPVLGRFFGIPGE